MLHDVNWATCQKFSDQLLAEGLLFLRSQEAVKSQQIHSEKAGNYLVSLNGNMLYIGEAKNLASRIRQQFTPKISTFYKTYTKRATELFLIEAFRVRSTETAIGRKEIEEFGIVNAECSLNKFQRGKRSTVTCATSTAIWTEVQKQYATIISQGEIAVLSEPCKPWFEASAEICAGIYVARASKHENILYIGESSRVKDRHKCHSGTTYFSALRRHVGTDLLGFSLKVRNGKAKYFTEDEDSDVTDFLRSCYIACLPITFGRFELEEHLIRKFRPQLNRKDNVAAS